MSEFTDAAQVLGGLKDALNNVKERNPDLTWKAIEAQTGIPASTLQRHFHEKPGPHQTHLITLLYWVDKWHEGLEPRSAAIMENSIGA